MKSYLRASLAATVICVAGSAASSAVIFEGTHTFQEVDYIPFSAFGLTEISVCSRECYSDFFDTSIFFFADDGSLDELDPFGANDDSATFDPIRPFTSDSRIFGIVLNGDYILAVGGSFLSLEDALDGVNEGERSGQNSFRSSFSSLTPASSVSRYRVTITGDNVAFNSPEVPPLLPAVPLPAGFLLLLTGLGMLGVARRSNKVHDI